MDYANIHFLSSDEEDRFSWIQQFCKFHEEINIHRTIVLVNNHMIMNYLSGLLEKENYSVHVVKESLNVANSIESFIKSLKRILFITVQDFLQSKNDVLIHLMNEHNLLILENLRDDQETETMKMIHSAIHTGFLNIEKPYYIWINE